VNDLAASKPAAPAPRSGFRFDRSLLVRLFGARAALLHGDMMMLDRWQFVKTAMPRTRNDESVFDVGCGTGASRSTWPGAAIVRSD
jgi:hypothetical protein